MSVTTDQVNIALILQGAHVWDPTSRLCTCGEFFEAVGLERNGHPQHVMRKVLESHELLATPDQGMDMHAAFRDTLMLGVDRGMHRMVLGNDVSFAHLDDMYKRIDGTFSSAKLGRWLGYAQACLVGARVASVEELKAINRRRSGNPTNSWKVSYLHSEDCADCENLAEEAISRLMRPEYSFRESAISVEFKYGTFEFAHKAEVDRA